MSEVNWKRLITGGVVMVIGFLIIGLGLYLGAWQATGAGVAVAAAGAVA